MIDNHSSEQLLVMTDHQEIKAILRAVNELLSHNQANNRKLYEN